MTIIFGAEYPGGVPDNWNLMVCLFDLNGDGQLGIDELKVFINMLHDPSDDLSTLQEAIYRCAPQ